MKKKIILASAVIAIMTVALLTIVTKRATAPDTKPRTGQNSSALNNVNTANPQPAGLNKSRYSTTDSNSIWVIANKVSPLPAGYAPGDLVTPKLGGQLRSEAAQALDKMQLAAEASSIRFKMISAYRSYSVQQTTYARNVANDGQAQADRSSARPGHSEHQTGLAADIGSTSCDLEICFGETAAGKWLAEHAHEYGYIVRYLDGKEAVTGYQYEPWHLRYVGVDLARELHSSKQTMEEFFGVVPAKQPF